MLTKTYRNKKKKEKWGKSRWHRDEDAFRQAKYRATRRFSIVGREREMISDYLYPHVNAVTHE